ncbi:MAG: recombination protein NinB, partial [Ectothiorhodospiraceae bacterium]|nr:recombination protein NinB [Ectothiorhodospiraceae bacterium]
LMAREEWKDLFTTSLRKQSMAPGIDGGMVILGLHTRRLSKQEFSDLIELMYEFGSNRDVRWSESAKKLAEDNRASRAKTRKAA